MGACWSLASGGCGVLRGPVGSVLVVGFGRRALGGLVSGWVSVGACASLLESQIVTIFALSALLTPSAGATICGFHYV